MAWTSDGREYGPLTRYIKLRVAHALGMPGTFSPSARRSDLDMHHGTCVTQVPWCMPGSLTSGFLWSWWWENVPGIPCACATRNFTYLVRGQWFITAPWIKRVDVLTHWHLENFNFLSFKWGIFKLILVTGGLGGSWLFAPRLRSLGLSDNESTLAQVMAWCHQATSHYPSQRWSRFMSPYGVTGPHCIQLSAICLINMKSHGRNFSKRHMRDKQQVIISPDFEITGIPTTISRC